MFSNEAFARTAERYMDTIYRVAYGWLKNPDDANDVTQDVLIELYKTEKAFESDGPPQKLAHPRHRQSL